MMDLQSDNNGFQCRTEQVFFFFIVHQLSNLECNLFTLLTYGSIALTLSCIHCENIDFPLHFVYVSCSLKKICFLITETTYHLRLHDVKTSYLCRFHA